MMKRTFLTWSDGIDEAITLKYAVYVKRTSDRDITIAYKLMPAEVGFEIIKVKFAGDEK